MPLGPASSLVQHWFDSSFLNERLSVIVTLNKPDDFGGLPLLLAVSTFAVALLSSM